METAREKFKVGQRVRMTKEALDRGFDGPIVKRSTGVVKRLPKTSRSRVIDPRVLVSVLRDGEYRPRQYHMKFWEPDNGHTKD